MTFENMFSTESLVFRLSLSPDVMGYRFQPIAILRDCSCSDSVSIAADVIGVNHVDMVLLRQIRDPEVFVSYGAP